jgi:hypothetical protein
MVIKFSIVVLQEDLCEEEAALQIRQAGAT